jgi:EmrB/QacA subfamily drug resistance transporter
VLLAITGVALLINYVETMILPGIPTIQKDFSTTSSIASWITSAFLITGCAASPFFGKLGDTYGRKKMFLVALSFYIFGVGIAGFSPSIYFLIFSRAVQGVGFAIMPLGLAIVTDVFPKEKVATAQGIISATFAIGASAGLVIGSYVVQDWGWQYAFHSAVILSIVLFVIVAKAIRKDVPHSKSSVDYIGVSLLMASVTGLLLYVTEGPTLGWYSLDNILLLLCGVVFGIAFIVLEQRQKNPLMQFSLLKIRNVLVSNAVGVISGASMFMIFFAVIYYAQLPKPLGLGLDIIQAGLTLAPATLVMLVVGPLIGRLTSRFGPKPMLIGGSSVMIVGLIFFIFKRGTTMDLTLDAIIGFVGMVSIIIPIVNMISISLPQENVAVGLGMNTMLRNLGGAIGPVVATTIMTTYTTPLKATIGGQVIVLGHFASSAAFNMIFEIAIAMLLIVPIISLAVKNYSFGKKAKD